MPYWLTDAAFAAMALQLLAVEAGLGCCFFGPCLGMSGRWLNGSKVPESARAVGTVAIGHPDPTRARDSGSVERGRRPLNEVFTAARGDPLAGLGGPLSRPVPSTVMSEKSTGRPR
ncbi:MAG: hypothetical protein CM1200mP26_15380 [Acidimicrobiales bacterium]|nr:MAG: hypothetical protein CM1200mP26_15380 [Acidimicrobiales bacterium]